jgi:hypothetical protein
VPYGARAVRGILKTVSDDEDKTKEETVTIRWHSINHPSNDSV